MKTPKGMMLAYAVAIAVPLISNADNRYVLPRDGVPSSGAVSSVWTDSGTYQIYSSVADAVVAAGSADTIILAPGTHDVTTPIVVDKPGLNIQNGSWSDADLPVPREDVVLDGGGSSQIMDLKASDARVCNLTFANGSIDVVDSASAIFAEPTASSFNLSNCVFRGNNSTGSCLLVTNANSWIVQDCVFSNNSLTAEASVAGGSAIRFAYVNGITQPSQHGTIRGCYFKDNSVLASNVVGGVVRLQQGRTTIEGCTFDSYTARQTTDSPASFSGGCLRVHDGSTIKDCTFTGTATVYTMAKKYMYGIVMYITGSAEGVSNCTFRAFTENYITGCTSGRYGTICVANTPAEIRDCRFIGNSFASDALIFVNNVKDTRVRNCLFARNERTSSCEIFQRYYPTDPTKGKSGMGFVLENCTIADNQDSAAIFAVPNGGYTNLAVNCIFTATNKLRAADSTSPLMVSNCCLSAFQSIGGLTYDPQCFILPQGGHRFLCPAEYDYRLHSESPLRDRGVELGWMTADAVDLDGKPRVVGTLPDLGCCEWQSGDYDNFYTKRLVSTVGEATGDWADAFTDFQTAIDGTPDGWRLLVKPGLYQPAATLVISNRSLEVVSCGADGNPDPANTIIDGAGARRVMLVHWGDTSIVESDLNPVNWRPVLLEGLTFTNGVALTNGPTASQPFAGNGGGLLFYGRSPGAGWMPSRVINCRFADCEAVNGGGAAFFGGWVENCTFTGCTAIFGGGGCGVEPSISATKVIDLTTGLSWYSATLIGCSFINNVAHRSGGGYTCSTNNSAVHTYVANCNFISNVCDTVLASSAWSRQGSGLAHPYGSLVTNCTFIGNSGAGYGAFYPRSYTLGVDLVFEDNASDTGSIYTGDSNVEIERSRFTETRTSAVFGGGTYRNCLMVIDSSTFPTLMKYNTKKLTLENCTLVNKNGYVIGYRNDDNMETWVLTLVNCILWRTSGSFVKQNSARYNPVYATNCCFSTDIGTVQLFYQTNCFVNAKPGFVNAAANDWMIRGSVCRDNGLMLPWMTTDAIDLIGNPRVVTQGRALAEDPSALPDLGCYELQNRLPGTVMMIR